MNYSIAIPSYKRVSTLKEKTLLYLLERTNVDRKRIFIFVADKDEEKQYKKAFPSLKIVKGVPTLRGQRSFIRKYFKAGSFVFSIDDDISGIYKANSSERKDLVEVSNLDKLIKEGFSLCQKAGTKLWGCSAVLNPFFMSGKGVSFDLKYICGGAYGEIVDKDKFLDVELEDKEDFERSVRFYHKFGSVVRFNEYALDTRGYAGAGGMQETRTVERVRNSAYTLVQMFPSYCAINTSKKNKKFVEVKLRAK